MATQGIRIKNEVADMKLFALMFFLTLIRKQAVILFGQLEHCKILIYLNMGVQSKRWFIVSSEA